MIIINLTQHAATAEQVAAGVTDLPAELRQRLGALLTFDTLPTRKEVESRAEQIASLAASAEPLGDAAAMIGGAPFLMSDLETELRRRFRITPLYAFSRRESVEQQQPDGSVRKVNVFRHAGFVPA